MPSPAAARLLCLAALGSALLALPAAAGEPRCEPPAGERSGLLLHASFDSGPTADFATGRAEPHLGEQGDPRAAPDRARRVPGRFGAGITRVSGELDALGNVLPERGTLAFFARVVEGESAADPLQLRSVDWYYWKTWLRIAREPENLAVWLADEALRITRVPGPSGSRLERERWSHLALAWDQAYGATLYLDGERVASNWGRASWVSRGVDPAALRLAWKDGSLAYDELYVFDRALDDRQVRALAERNEVPAPDALPVVALDAGRRTNRRYELGWEEGRSDLPVLQLTAGGSAELHARQIVPRDARALLAEAGAVFDGKLGQGWPSPLVRYGEEGRDGLAVAIPEPFDLLVLEGRFRGRVHAGRWNFEPRTAPLHTLESGRHVTRVRPAEPRSGWLSFFFADRPEYERGRIVELGFFRIGDPRPEPGRTRRWHLAACGKPAKSPLDGERAARFGPGDRSLLPLRAEPPGSAAALQLAALRFQHLEIPPREEPWGLRGLRISLALRGAKRAGALRVELRDPLLPGRRLLAFDARLEPQPGVGDARVELALDLADRVIPAQRPLWLTLVSEQDLELVVGGGDGGSRIETVEDDPRSVVPGFVERELPFLRTWFRALSEPRAWVNHEHPEHSLAPFDPQARQLFAPLAFLYALAPENPKLRALWLWTHKFEEPERQLELAPPAGHPAAPRWALLERELLRRCREVLRWWIENRQSERGAFGDDWNDDTDLIQNFPGVALVADPAGALRASAARVADGVYAAGRMRESGLSALVQGPLHAYEDGANAQQVMALLDPGNPVYLERLMQTARATGEQLMVQPKPGRSAFRSARFSADQVLGGPWAWDSPGHAVLLGPAATVAYYNRNERALGQLRSWVDGWLDAWAEAQRTGEHPAGRPFAARRRPDGTVLEWDRLPRGWGFASLFPALDALTGDPRYREALRYWTDPPPPGAFLETMSELHLVLGLVNRPARGAELLHWSWDAGIARLSDDALGDAARRRLFEWELTGNESAAIEALEAALANVVLLRDAYTWAEPNADRIWLPFAPLSVLAQGGIAHQRNQLWPQHDLSWAGLSDFAAWVRERGGDRLRVWLYSFAGRAETGHVRLWRIRAGTYRVRIGPDADGDGAPDSGEVREVRLARFAELPFPLAPGVRTALEITPVSLDASEPPRPDLALSSPRWSGRDLEVTLHNLGSAPAHDVRVRVLDAGGATLAEQRVADIEAPLDLVPRRSALRFPGLVRTRAAALEVDPSEEIAELNETNNRLGLTGLRSYRPAAARSPRSRTGG